MVELPVGVVQAALQMPIGSDVSIDGANDKAHPCRCGQGVDPRLPNGVLKSSFNDEGYFAREQERDGIEEGVCCELVGVWRKLIVTDAVSVDVSFLNFVPADDGQVEEFGQLFRKRGFACAGFSSDDDAFRFVRHLMIGAD